MTVQIVYPKLFQAYNHESGVIDLEIIGIAKALLESYALCDHCLGRQFAMLGHGLTNHERGNAIKLLLIVEGNRLALDGNELGRRTLELVAVNGISELASKTLEALGLKFEKRKNPCHICNGAFGLIEELAQGVARKLSEYEYETFLIGIKIPNEVEEREDELRARFNIRWGESIRNEFSRETGKKVAEVAGKAVEHKGPDLIAIVNPFTKQISVEVNPLYIAGRYKKLIRGFPQARWICGKCSGKGCSECGWTGKKYSESVEELIAPKIKERAGGLDAILHAAGREDIDVRVLGSGRPFVVEIKEPKVRKIDLRTIQDEINKEAQEKIEIVGLKFSSKEGVRKLKEEGQATKVSRAIVEFERNVSDEELSQIREGLDNKLIRQLTPSHVMHRRSVRLRKKYLYGVELKRLKSNLVEMLIRCQGGLYIKELISGDDGRTTPSVAEIVNAQAKCIELDVMDVCVEVD